MYDNGKKKHVETVPGMGGEIKENDERINSTMTYCKNFDKCQ
jgi:hypothetical protein